MSPSSKALPYVMKNTYIQVTIPGKGPFSLNSSHPTFLRLKNAIKRKNWKMIPKLVNLAENIVLDSHGEVEVKGGVILYKGRSVKTLLADRIGQLVEQGKPVKYMLRFMDNLYQNPSEQAVRSFYEWLENNDLPITDDGCFLAYKSVDKNLKDEHTHKIDNSPGQTIMMSRKVANTDYDNQCSTGFHICSKQYGLYGAKVLAVKANPKHVLSAVSGKMRVTQYEVIKYLGTPGNDIDFKKHGFSELERQLVVELSKERREVIKIILSNPMIKRLIRRKKLSKTTIQKAAYARLKSIVQKYGLIPKIGPEDTRSLEHARKAAGISVGQLAREMKVGYKSVSTLEKKENPTPRQVADYLDALGKITGNYNISYPKAVA